MNKRGEKIKVIRQRPITPEQDQSRVIQCTLDEGIGDTTVCQKSVDAVTIETTKTRVLIGEGIFRKNFKKSMDDNRITSTMAIAAKGIEFELTGISKVGPLLKLLKTNKV